MSNDNYNTNRESNLSPIARSILVLSGTPSSPAIQLFPSNISHSCQSTVIDVRKLNFSKTCLSPSSISISDKTTELTDLEGMTYVIDESFIGAVNTSSSSFKNSHLSYIDTQQSATFSNEPQISTPNAILEFLQKMNRTICNKHMIFIK